MVSTNQASRRAAEDALARELTRRGAVGVAAYTVLGDVDLKNEGRIKEAFEQSGAARRAQGYAQPDLECQSQLAGGDEQGACVFV